LEFVLSFVVWRLVLVLVLALALALALVWIWILFFSFTSSDHPKMVVIHVLDILMSVVEETDFISRDLLDLVLRHLVSVRFVSLLLFLLSFYSQLTI
jgi:hypothetical protein